VPFGRVGSGKALYRRVALAIVRQREATRRKLRLGLALFGEVIWKKRISENFAVGWVLN